LKTYKYNSYDFPGLLKVALEKERAVN